MVATAQSTDPRPGAVLSALAPATPRRREWLAAGIAILLVVTLVAATHWPVLRAQALSFDDDAFVTYNPLVGHPSWASVAQFFREVLHPSTVRGYYLPLSMTSLMVDVALGGTATDLTAFHRTSLLLHVLNAVLVLLVLYRLFGALLPATVAALLFGLHPLTVEPVVWIGERKTLLATLFALATILTHLEWLRGRRQGWRFISLALYLLALLAKPTVVMLPLLLLLLDAWPLRRLGWASAREKWPYFLLSAASGVITLASHERSAGITSMTAVDYLHWPLHAGYLLAFYLGKIIRPIGLTSVYSQPEPFGLGNPAVAGGLAITVALMIIVVLAARRWRAPLVGWLWFVIAISPTLGLVQYSWVIASDKYVYLPALGILMLICAASAALAAQGRFARRAPQAALLVAAAAILVAEASGTRAAIRPWSNSLGLFQHMEKLAPKSPPIQNTLGSMMLEKSAPDLAIPYFRRAVAYSPTYQGAVYNLGLALACKRQYEEAVAHLRTASQLVPDDPDAAYALGAVLRLAGRTAEAEQQFQRALQLEPRRVAAYAHLGDMLALGGHLQPACDQFRQAIAIDPLDANLRFKLGSALVLAARPRDAAQELREAVRLRPDWDVALNALAWLLATTPDQGLRAPGEALGYALKASQLAGDANPEILDTVAAAQAAGGGFAEAGQTARRAVDLARAGRAEGLARMIQDRADLYARGIAYVEEPAQAAPRPR